MSSYLKNRKDLRTREYRPVKRIIWATDGKVAPENADSLINAPEIQSCVEYPGKACILRPGCGLLLDFGIELHGGVRIVVGNCDQSQLEIRIRFGESVSEAMYEPNNDHAIHDSLVKLPRFGMTEFGNTGFRFVRIDVPDDLAVEKFELLGVSAVSVYYDLEYAGSFNSSDERLNRIWKTGAYTVHLNMQDYIYDGIKRDRLVWCGDLHPEVKVICAVFNDCQLIPKTLDFVRDKTSLPAFMNGMSSYSLWWIITHYDYYWHSSDIEYLKEQRSYMIELLTLMAKYIGPEGQEQLPEGRFFDWNSYGDPFITHAGLHGLMIWAFKTGKYLCSVLGEKVTEYLCADVIRRMSKYNPDAGKSKTGNALKVIAGICDPGKINKEILAKEATCGLSTFLGYYVLQARAMAGDYIGAMNVIRQYWGAMLDFGATSFWEDFDLDWIKNASRIDELPLPGKDDLHADFGAHCYKGLRHSLCHGWAGSPTAWLSENILGIKFLEPGGASIKIEPHLGDLNYVEGVFPAPYGNISVSAEKKENGKIICNVQAPSEVNVIHNEWKQKSNMRKSVCGIQQ